MQLQLDLLLNLQERYNTLYLTSRHKAVMKMQDATECGEENTSQGN